MPIIADLHMHSNSSDGLDTPEALLARAAKRGLSVVSITDHDTLAAYENARPTAARLGLELITGIEVSSTIRNLSVHILGYFVDETTPAAKKLVEGTGSGRMERMERMLKKMDELGYKVEMNDLLSFIGDATVGRGGLARYLVKKGHFKNTDEAFEKLLGDNKPVFEPVKQFTPQEAIRLITEAGGIASLAHPGNDITEADLAAFVEAGLSAVEAITTHHSPQQIAKWTALAAQYGIAVTGGSDCHGPLWKNKDTGAAGLDMEMLQAFKAKTQSSRPEAAA